MKELTRPLSLLAIAGCLAGMVVCAVRGDDEAASLFALLLVPALLWGIKGMTRH